MKVIIAGCRNYWDQAVVDKAIADSGFAITRVVSGKAPGVDSCGEAWAKKNGIEVVPFRAKWTLYGKPAGPMRNTEMAAFADALIAVWDGKSTGTGDMIQKAKARNLPTYIHYI